MLVVAIITYKYISVVRRTKMIDNTNYILYIMAEMSILYNRAITNINIKIYDLTYLCFDSDWYDGS